MPIEEFIIEVDDELYNKANLVCKQYGLTVEDAVTLFIKECAGSKQVPVDLKNIDGKINNIN